MYIQDLKFKTKVGAYWQLFNQFATNGVIFFVSIVMARLLTPQDFGTTAIPAAFMAIAEIFIESGFSSALVRKDEVTEEDMSTAFYVSISVGIVCYIILFFCSPLIASFYNEPVLTKLMRVTSLAFLIAPLTIPQTVLLKRRIDFKTPAKVTIAAKILSGAAGIFFAYIGYGLWALVIANLSGIALTFLFNWIAVRWYPKAGWSKESFKYLFGYGSKMLLTYLIDRIYMNIAPLFIGKFYNTTQLGVYNTAERYTNLPSRMLLGVVQNVTFPVLCKIKNDEVTLARSYRKMMKVTVFIVFPVMLMLAILAEPLVVLLVTDKWIACVPYMQILCFAVMWNPVHSLNLNLLLIKGRSDLFLKLEIIKVSIALGIMAITLPMGIEYFLWGRVASSLISLYINTYYTGKLINVGFFTQMKDVFPSLILSAVTAAIAYFIVLLFDNMWLKLIIGGGVGVGSYVAVSLLFKFPEWDEVRYMFKRN